MNAQYEAMLINAPKTARGRETLERICRAAEQLFGEKGYHGTMISDITKLAHVSAGTFYIYFESKLSLYRYLLSQYGHLIRKHVSMAVANCKTRREAEREGLRAWLGFVAEHRYVFNITWESLFIDQELFDDYYATFSAAYAEHLRDSQEKGEVKGIDPEVLSFALMGINNFIGLRWVIFKKEQDLDYIVDEVMKLLEGMFFDK